MKAKTVHPRTLDGEFNQDIKFVARDRFQTVIEDMMRESGYVPVIDRDTEWYTRWIEDTDRYGFKIVMYGVYVGPKKAEQILGYLEETKEFVDV